MKSSIGLLIQVAASDAVISATEAKIIRHIAHANGIAASDVNQMLNDPQRIPVSETVPVAERFEVLYLIIQMMQADGQTFTSEMQFCERLASGLGYRPQVVRAIAHQLTTDPTIGYDRAGLKRRAEKFAAAA